jgi:2'-hydroxyisoflavone reductase
VPEHIDDRTYGMLKVLCEDAAVSLFGPQTLVIRPTYVVGPFDHTGRFGYWVRRLARGGQVLAPGHADRAMQVIDARDQAAFVIAALEGGVAGRFHTVRPPMTFGGMLDAVAAAVAPEGTELVWVEPEFLLAAGQTGESLPLWYAGVEEDAAINGADPAAALAAGMELRPFDVTVRDVLASVVVRSEFLSPEEEVRLLQAW